MHLLIDQTSPKYTWKFSVIRPSESSKEIPCNPKWKLENIWISITYIHLKFQKSHFFAYQAFRSYYISRTRSCFSVLFMWRKNFKESSNFETLLKGRERQREREWEREKGGDYILIKKYLKDLLQVIINFKKN
jgi:hypothetical protein